MTAAADPGAARARAAFALARRYAELGLVAAATDCAARAEATPTADGLAARTELALLAGDGAAARTHARPGGGAPGAGARLLLGQAQLAVGELDAARLALAAAARCLRRQPSSPRAGASRARRGRQPTRREAAVAERMTAWSSPARPRAPTRPTPLRCSGRWRRRSGGRGRPPPPRSPRGLGPRPGARDRGALADDDALAADVVPHDLDALDAAIGARVDADAEVLALIVAALRLDPTRDAWWRDAAWALSALGPAQPRPGWPRWWPRRAAPGRRRGGRAPGARRHRRGRAPRRSPASPPTATG
ncbi:MAG: hypothetical protein R2939_19980 [Kofleriaceae bacterium]